MITNYGNIYIYFEVLDREFALSYPLSLSFGTAFFGARQLNNKMTRERQMQKLHTRL
jgi:hypothetical protein